MLSDSLNSVMTTIFIDCSTVAFLMLSMYVLSVDRIAVEAKKEGKEPQGQLITFHLVLHFVC